MSTLDATREVTWQEVMVADVCKDDTVRTQDPDATPRIVVTHPETRHGRIEFAVASTEGSLPRGTWSVHPSARLLVLR